MRKFSESNTGKMVCKLGIDVHGVVDDLPEFFSFLTQLIISSGGEVHIITGGTWDKNLENSIVKAGVKWTHYFSVYDHLILNAKSEGTYKFSDGTIQEKFDDDVWNKAKGDYCRKHNISLHIDDTIVYGDYFTTPFARLYTKNK